MIQSSELILKVNNRQLLAKNLALVKDQPSCRLMSDTASASTTLSVDNATGIVTDDYVIIGEFGDKSAEIRKVTVSGNTITVSATTYDHYRGTKITKIPYNQIQFSYAATLTGIKTAFSPISEIDCNSTNTQKVDAGSGGAFTGRNYYFFRFYNSTTSVYSEYSTGVYYTGNELNSVYNICISALNRLGMKIGERFATQDELLQYLRDGIEEIIHWTRPDSYLNVDWNFEIYTDNSSLVATENVIDFLFSEMSYAPKYISSKQGIYSFLFGTKPLTYIDPDQMDNIYIGKPNTTLSAEATAGATTITLTDSTQFDDSGVVYVGSNVITYTDNDTTTGILSGIPTSGDGAIDTTVASGGQVWQNITPGEPSRYTVYEDRFRVDVPIETSLVGYVISLKYLRSLTNITSFQEVISIPFYSCLSDYIESRIEGNKRNSDRQSFAYAMFKNKVDRAALTYQIPINTVQTYQHFNFEKDERIDDVFDNNDDN